MASFLRAGLYWDNIVLATISIGIPFYNDREYLAGAIKSVLLQSFVDWELILINDGSTDGSDMIAASFPDPRIRIIHCSENLGLSVRLNQIAREANGRFLFRMDADDMMHPDRLKKQLNELHRKAVNAVIGSTAIEIDNFNCPRRIIRSRVGQGFRARQSFIHPTVAACTQWFRDNPYSESVMFRRSQDAELWVRTASKSEFWVLDEPLLFYRRSPIQSFDKYIWQAAALLKILTRPEVGRRGARLVYGAVELAKLQMRFIQVLMHRSVGETPISTRIASDLAQYRQVIDRILGIK